MSLKKVLLHPYFLVGAVVVGTAVLGPILERKVGLLKYYPGIRDWVAGSPSSAATTTQQS